MTKSEVIAWCRQKLAKYKLPRQVEFRTELPKTMVGKVLRRALRAEEAEKTEARAARRAARKAAGQAPEARDDEPTDDNTESSDLD